MVLLSVADLLRLVSISVLLYEFLLVVPHNINCLAAVSRLCSPSFRNPAGPTEQSCFQEWDHHGRSWAETCGRRTSGSDSKVTLSQDT